MSTTIPDVGQNTAEISNNLINAMSKEPCYLAIIVIFIICWLIIRSNNKHQEKMEIIRIKQSKNIKGVDNDN